VYRAPDGGALGGWGDPSSHVGAEEPTGVPYQSRARPSAEGGSLKGWVLLASLALPVLGGCVGKKKYDALQAEYDAFRTEMTGKLGGESARATSLEAALAEEKARSASLEQQRSDMEARIATLLKDKSSLDASVAQMQLALKDLEARKAQADARIAEFKALLGKFQAMIDAGKLKVKIVNGRMVVELASDILFASGSAGLSPEGKAAIAEVATVLASIADRTYQVEGHTDDVPIHTERFPSNWELGTARAVTVVQALEQGGVPVARLSAASYAENRPVMPNKTPEGKSANRRIEIVIVPDLSQLPGYDELQKMAAKP
jgi:chemotaxis protein MotB